MIENSVASLQGAPFLIELDELKGREDGDYDYKVLMYINIVYYNPATEKPYWKL